MLDGRWRAKFERGLAPVGRALPRAGITADALTVIGLVASAVTALLLATGHLGWALLGGVFTTAPDVLDGSVARQSGRAGPRGAFFDSVADRASDAMIFGGVAFYLSGQGNGRGSVLALAVLACSMLISYERAKAESLGFDARGGLMERAERLAALGIGVVFGILVPMLWIMLVLTAATVVQRFVKVWRQAPAPERHHPRRSSTRPSSTTRDADGGLAQWWASRRPQSDRARTREVQGRSRRRTRP